MEENYYDILEVSKNASPEIIEKAYKILVKKYHPDLQENNLKIKYEEKIKKINEAYDVLSNPEKRNNYDLYLKNNEISQEDYNNLYQENINLKNEINYLKNTYNQIQNYYNHFITNNEENTYSTSNKFVNINNNSYRRKYTILDNLKYKFKSCSKNIIALFITILILIFIFLILWNIPFTKNYFINLYNENSILQFIVNIFLNLF